MTTVRTTIHDPLSIDVIADGLGFPEGPCIRDDGSVVAVDIDRGTIVQAADGAATVLATPGGGPNGMALTADGTAYVANNGGFLWSEVGGFRIPIDRETHTNEPPGFIKGWIERIDLVTGEVTVLNDSCNGRHLRGPNDLVFDEVGGLWFTDHGKGRRASVDRGGLYYLPPGASEVREIASLARSERRGLVPRQPPRLCRRDVHGKVVGLGARLAGHRPPGCRLAGGPPRWRVRGGDAVLVRLACRRAGRARRHWRDR